MAELTSHYRHCKCITLSFGQLHKNMVVTETGPSTYPLLPVPTQVSGAEANDTKLSLPAPRPVQ
jgi:hypothetical protein